MNAHAKILKSHPSFSVLSSRVLNRLTEHSSIEECPKGSTIYREGDPGKAIYLVISGRCQAVQLSPQGSLQVLQIYGPGDTFGERALLSQGTHWTSVQVITDSVLLRLDGEDVHRLMEKEPKLAKQLVSRLRDHMRSLRPDPDHPPALGRVVAVAGMSDRVNATTIAENLSLALRKETGASVLLVRFLSGSGEPALARVDPADGRSAGSFNDAALLTEGREGLKCLNVYARGGDDECSRVPALIGRLARHVQYVVMIPTASLAADVGMAVQRQSDFSYILFTQRPEDLYRTNLFLRGIRTLPGNTPNSVRPVVCLDAGERCRPYEELRERLGEPVHAALRNVPRAAAGTDAYYLEQPGDRFSINIRYLAREIGRCRVGLALSSGGAKGFAHVGVLNVLEENGIHIDVIAGASMGAYVGALRAFGFCGEELTDLALRTEGRFGLLKVMDPVFPPRRGFMKGKRARRWLEKAIGDAHFSDLVMQFRAVATDLDTLERVIFDTGQVSTAVHASMAIPGVVVPVPHGERILVDGGASEPLPVNTLLEMGVERIIAVNTIPNPEEITQHVRLAREVAAAPGAHRHRLPSLKHYLNYFDEGNILDIVLRGMHALQTRVVEGACKQADVVLRPVFSDGRWYDFGRPRRYMELGRTVAEVHLPELLALTRPPSPGADPSPPALEPAP